jgi:hypothetical protein
VIARRLLLASPLCLLAAPARAVTLDGRIEQGAFVTGMAAPGTRLALDGRGVRVAASGAFAFGFGRDAAEKATLAVTRPGGARETVTLAVARRQWIEQHITGLPPAMVTPPPETLERIARERP